MAIAENGIEHDMFQDVSISCNSCVV